MGRFSAILLLVCRFRRSAFIQYECSGQERSNTILYTIINIIIRMIKTHCWTLVQHSRTELYLIKIGTCPASCATCGLVVHSSKYFIFSRIRLLQQLHAFGYIFLLGRSSRAAGQGVRWGRGKRVESQYCRHHTRRRENAQGSTVREAYNN